MAPEARHPDVSVVMPVHGTAAFLAPALDSVLGQQGVSLEVICVDDGVAEPAAGYLRDLAGRVSNLRVVPSGGRGISAALNRGIELARARFVARMDADDICLPGRLAVQAAHLEAHPAIGVLGGQALAIDARGRASRKVRVAIGVGSVMAGLEAGSPLIHPTVMTRRHLLLEAGGYRSIFDGAEDYELWLRLSRLTHIDNLAQTLLLYRQHHGQTTRSRQLRQARLAALALMMHRMAAPPVWAPGADDALSIRQARLDLAWQGRVPELRCLTASFLVDNGGTLRSSGARYLRRACARAIKLGPPDIARRIALACVRHQMQLARAGRWGEAATTIPLDLLRWRTRLLASYVRHASILWRSAKLASAEPSRGEPG